MHSSTCTPLTALCAITARPHAHWAGQITSSQLGRTTTGSGSDVLGTLKTPGGTEDDPGLYVINRLCISARFNFTMGNSTSLMLANFNVLPGSDDSRLQHGRQTSYQYYHSSTWVPNNSPPSRPCHGRPSMSKAGSFFPRDNAEGYDMMTCLPSSFGTMECLPQVLAWAWDAQPTHDSRKASHT